MSKQPSSAPTLHGIRDNHQRGKVIDFLAHHVTADSQLAIVSAYFTIYAYDALATELDQIQHLRFLFGEPSFITALDPNKNDKKYFNIADEGLDLANRLRQRDVARRCANWIREKVEIRSMQHANLLHGKLYHIHYGNREHALLGSSNFTQRGLGLSATPNIELNLIVDGDRDRADLKTWFDELWKNQQLVVDVKDAVLRYLEQLYVNHNAEFIYYKTLYHVFERFLISQERDAALFEQTALVDSAIWQALFDFQRDGVKGALRKINAHNGCILADSVGLGKTYTALAVIKYHELRNQRVMVLCPKRLRENWTVYLAQNNSELNPFVRDRFAYTVLSHTDLSRSSGKVDGINLATFNWNQFDLIVIDESHHFRNALRSKRDDSGRIMRKSRYERLLEDIVKSGIKTRVLLLSATPVNNDLRDLRNQIYLITEGRDDAFAKAFGIRSIKEILTDAQKKFIAWAQRSGNKNANELMADLSVGFFTLLDELTIARSRQHLHKHYQASIAQIGQFPQRKKPDSIFPEIDLQQQFPSYQQLSEDISGYKLSLFNPACYVLPDFAEHYAPHKQLNFTQTTRETFLIGMMKVNFLKRLESSVFSFAITMQRTVEKIEQLEQRLRQFQAQHQQAEISVQIDELDEEDDELAEAFQVGGKLKFQMAHLDIAAWLNDLAADKQQLSSLANTAQAVTIERDEKLAKLKEIISKKVTHPTTNRNGEKNRKVLIFCAFADTACYLYDALETWVKNSLKVHIALVSGGSKPNRTTLGNPDFTQILIHFAPRAKRREQIAMLPQDEEIDILIATDCISEGQNLQDCDLLVNYDIHWNPVRIIQRFGRIDRIGSLNTEIQLINFWPTPDLNQYINLQNRVEARMALVDIAATAEDNILLPEDLRKLAKDDLSYRDKQLLRLQDEVLDLEDFNESVALTAFTLDDFRLELNSYIQANLVLLQDAPLGLYAVVPVCADYPSIQPGVIFCLRQRLAGDDADAVNPLHPYFLVYVNNDGEVRYHFTSPKQILEIWRALSVDQTKPYAELCDLFDAETQHGQEMSKYNALLIKAVAVIAKQFNEKNSGNLFSSRGGQLIAAAQRIQSATDFDLVTWLVIK
ncbi:helicase-related protein [Chromatium okenii]|uniref:helicase-related protein n=1 Tax=Chromatium okenii TaxID=61644 RepID=UPI0026E98ABA|nr:helicase-related protein [Chromatium okenii]MBV5310219.1 DEAD/DEAH box helicase family protein [Chromatium okenii]